MEIQQTRIFNCDRYCISHVYVDGKYVCDVIEDTDRGLTQTMSDAEIKKRKVYAKTAIPTGRYNVTTFIASPKFSKMDYYKKFCGGRVPRLLGVPGFDGILIHRGVNENSSAGCLIVGYNTIKGRVTNSQEAFEKLYKILKTAKDKIYITVSRKYKVT